LQNASRVAQAAPAERFLGKFSLAGTLLLHLLMISIGLAVVGIALTLSQGTG
jgi:hypothetical protein